MLKFLLNLLQVNYLFEIFQLKDIYLLKMGENIDDITIHKYYDMMKNIRLTTHVKFELVSPKQIIVKHGKYTWLNNFQFKTFYVWKNDSISNELIDEYNVVSVNLKKNYWRFI